MGNATSLSTYLYLCIIIIKLKWYNPLYESFGTLGLMFVIGLTYLPLNDQFYTQRKNRLAVSLYQSVTAFLAVRSKSENYLITCLIIAAIRIKIFNYLKILIINLYCLRQVIVYLQHFCLSLVDAITVLFNICVGLCRTLIVYKYTF